MKALSLRSVLSLSCVVALAPQVASSGNTPQYAEDGVTVVDLDGASPARVCRNDARWIRIGFDALRLDGGDSLELTSSGGDRLVFKGSHWNDRSFHTRALRGSCVTLAKSFADADSQYRLSGLHAGKKRLETTTTTIAGAGDLCDSTPNDCKRTSDVVISINPVIAFALGDNAYDSGTLAEFNTRYDPNWGRFKDITTPIPGNHEYLTSGAAGYFDYFNGVGNQTGLAGDRSTGYYSYDVGDWHFIALNSRTGGVVSATQLAWLDADLRANTKPCTAALIHHPFVSRGTYSPGIANMKAFFERLYAARVDLLLTGHDHNYQRYAPMDATQAPQGDGVRQVIVGTGGRNLGPTTFGAHPLLQASRGSTFGVLRLDLTPVDFAAQFVPVAGSTWTDSFSGRCHRADGIVGDYILSTSTSISIPRGSSGGKIVTVLSYGGFADPVDLAVTGLPAGVTATWSFDPVTAVADGNTTSRVVLRVSTTATAGTYPITVTGTAGEFARSVKFNLIVRS